MGVVDNAPGYKTKDFHVQYKLHVFHPRTNAHAGTLQLDIKWVGPDLNASPAKGEDFNCTWKWRGSPYGTVDSTFSRSKSNLQLHHPSSGLVRENMIMINDHWSDPGPTNVRPHPWFNPIDQIGLKDPNFVSAPQRPQTILRPEDPVAQQWVCKLLTWGKSARENTIP